MNVAAMRGQENNGAMLLDTLLSAAQGEQFRPFDVHLDRVRGGESSLLQQIVQTGHANRQAAGIAIAGPCSRWARE